MAHAGSEPFALLLSSLASCQGCMQLPAEYRIVISVHAWEEFMAQVLQFLRWTWVMSQPPPATCQTNAPWTAQEVEQASLGFRKGARVSCELLWPPPFSQTPYFKDVKQRILGQSQTLSGKKYSKLIYLFFEILRFDLLMAIFRFFGVFLLYILY